MGTRIKKYPCQGLECKSMKTGMRSVLLGILFSLTFISMSMDLKAQAASNDVMGTNFFPEPDIPMPNMEVFLPGADPHSLSQIESLAEIIPSERRIDWKPGIPGGIPEYPVCANVKDPPYSAVGDGLVDDTSAIQQAIDDCPSGTAVLLPAGDYMITSTLEIFEKAIVLRGEGPDQTRIYHAGDGNSVWLYRWTNMGPNIDITGGLEKDSTTITLADASSLEAGQYIIMSQLNKPGLVTSQGYSSRACTWCGDGTGERTMAQIVRVDAIQNNTLTLNRPLYFTFEASLDPEIVRVTLLEGAGIENLYIEQLNATGGDNQNIQIDHCANCWVKNVESYKPRGAHVRIRNSYACEIRDSFFHDGHDHGSGRAYGVFLFGRNSDHLIENNIIYKTRHAMILEGGGSGNVFGYNYADDGLSLPHPDWVTHDAATHGAHPYMNLFEGNIHDKIGHDNTWGSSSHNTHLRNHVDRSAVETTTGLWAVDIQSNNYYENLVGNILCEAGCSGTFNFGDDGSLAAIYKLGYDTPGDSSGPDDLLVESTLLRHGNFDFVTATTLWDPDVENHDIPVSYYLQSKPAFFGTLPWPAIGPDVEPMVGALPAKIRYQSYISEPDPRYQLEANPDTVGMGEQITVSWSISQDAPVAATDWIGLYAEGEPNNRYLAFVQADGTRSGSIAFAAPDVAGRYEFRYLLDGDYLDVARATIEVQSPSQTFLDVPVDHWAYEYIEALYQQGYVAGCSADPLMYCPESAMTRAESAVFVERGIHGADYTPTQPTEQVFADVPDWEWFFKWSTALWNDGYTAGCGTDPLIYCPLQEHTRTEGCVFFLRMLNGVEYVPPDTEGIFSDVPLEYWGARWIEAAYKAGLIPACATTPDLHFCPDEPLDRAMTAYMMVQAKGLQ
jgi:hypothetical protein